MPNTRRSLLPAPAAAGSQGRQSTRDHPEPLPNRAGAALQIDGFNLFVGRLLMWLGIAGSSIEVFTSTKAILIEFLSNPGSSNPGFWIELGFSAFFALAVEAGMLTLVINLHDSWINLFEGHPERAFVSEGEVNLQMLILWFFEFGGAGINCWWNIVFFNSITTSAFIVTTGCAVLLFSSLVMWPLGMKVARNAKRRIRAAKRLAAQMMQAAEQQRGGVRVVPAAHTGTSVVPYSER